MEILVPIVLQNVFIPFDGLPQIKSASREKGIQLVRFKQLKQNIATTQMLLELDLELILYIQREDKIDGKCDG